MPEERTRKIVYNIQAKRPACILLQAAMGGDPDAARRFAAETWITSGPDYDGLKLYQISESEFKQLIKITHLHHGIKMTAGI